MCHLCKQCKHWWKKLFEEDFTINMLIKDAWKFVKKAIDLLEARPIPYSKYSVFSILFFCVQLFNLRLATFYALMNCHCWMQKKLLKQLSVEQNAYKRNIGYDRGCDLLTNINQIRSDFEMGANQWKIRTNFDDWNAVRQYYPMSFILAILAIWSKQGKNPFSPTNFIMCYFLDTIWYVDDKIIVANLSMVISHCLRKYRQQGTILMDSNS